MERAFNFPCNCSHFMHINRKENGGMWVEKGVMNEALSSLSSSKQVITGKGIMEHGPNSYIIFKDLLKSCKAQRVSKILHWIHKQTYTNRDPKALYSNLSFFRFAFQVMRSEQEKVAPKMAIPGSFCQRLHDLGDSGAGRVTDWGSTSLSLASKANSLPWLKLGKAGENDVSLDLTLAWIHVHGYKQFGTSESYNFLTMFLSIHVDLSCQLMLCPNSLNKWMCQ